MKKICFLFSLLGSVCVCNAQSAGDILAQKIAKKMSDSLSLTGQGRSGIYGINQSLNNQKTIVWQQYGSTDSVGLLLQRVENTRDSLYGSVLTPSQYIIYRQKKKNLVNNN